MFAPWLVNKMHHLLLQFTLIESCRRYIRWAQYIGWSHLRSLRSTIQPWGGSVALRRWESPSRIIYTKTLDDFQKSPSRTLPGFPTWRRSLRPKTPKGGGVELINRTQSLHNQNTSHTSSCLEGIEESKLLLSVFNGGCPSSVFIFSIAPLLLVLGLWLLVHLLHGELSLILALLK